MVRKANLPIDKLMPYKLKHTDLVTSSVTKQINTIGFVYCFLKPLLYMLPLATPVSILHLLASWKSKFLMDDSCMIVAQILLIPVDFDLSHFPEYKQCRFSSCSFDLTKRAQATFSQAMPSVFTIRYQTNKPIIITAFPVMSMIISNRDGVQDTNMGHRNSSSELGRHRHEHGKYGADSF